MLSLDFGEVWPKSLPVTKWVSSKTVLEQCSSDASYMLLEYHTNSWTGVDHIEGRLFFVLSSEHPRYRVGIAPNDYKYVHFLVDQGKKKGWESFPNLVAHGEGWAILHK